MGIKGLMKFLQDASPKAIRNVDGPEAFTGRLLAIDASMCLYQFMIMIRENHSGSYQNLTNEAGEVTSHIIGMLSRTIRLMENGIKPVYVFDGKPPELKMAELEGRRAKATEAKATLAKALESGDQEQILKASKGTVRVSKEQNEQTKQLLRLMGVPVVEAPSEAEATCAALCRDGKVYASATEDADCLTFGTSVLIRNLMSAESQKKQVFEVQLSRVLEQLNITMDQFIDFCILSGCDYCDTLKGVGPSTAIKMIMQHGSIEKVLEQPEMAEKVPANFRYQAARAFFPGVRVGRHNKHRFQVHRARLRGPDEVPRRGAELRPEASRALHRPSQGCEEQDKAAAIGQLFRDGEGENQRQR